LIGHGFPGKIFEQNGRGGEIRVMWFLFGAIFWTLWTNRNDFMFKNKLISSPLAFGFKLLSFLQHGMVVTGGEDRRALEGPVYMTKVQVLMEMMAIGVE
jgi:hypothetical protein